MDNKQKFQDFKISCDLKFQQRFQRGWTRFQGVAHSLKVSRPVRHKLFICSFNDFCKLFHSFTFIFFMFISLIPNVYTVYMLFDVTKSVLLPIHKYWDKAVLNIQNVVACQSKQLCA